MFCPIGNPSQVPEPVNINPNQSDLLAVVVRVGTVPPTQEIPDHQVTVLEPTPS